MKIPAGCLTVERVRELLAEKRTIKFYTVSENTEYKIRDRYITPESTMDKVRFNYSSQVEYTMPDIGWSTEHGGYFIQLSPRDRETVVGAAFENYWYALAFTELHPLKG